MNKESVVLLSGGLDSAVCLYAEVGFWDTVALSIDYGQNQVLELERAAFLAKEVGVPHVILDADFTHVTAKILGDEEGQTWPRTIEAISKDSISPAYIPARNTVLISIAMSYADSIGAKRIVIGSNADDKAFPDCRPKYFEAINEVSKTGTRHHPEIVAPMIEKSKHGVYLEARRLRVPIGETLSCYAPVVPPTGIVWHCGKCDACVIRRDAMSRGKDPTRYWHPRPRGDTP